MSEARPSNNAFYVLTAVAGLASGVLFLALVSGVSAMPVIGYFVQLPLFFVGLSLGLTAAAFASAGSALIVLVSAGFSATLIFLLTQLLPVVVIVRYALWSRSGADKTSEWYPAGLLLGRLVGLVLAVTLGLLALTMWRLGSLDALFGQAMQDIELAFVAQGMPPGLADRLNPLIPFLPGIVAASWLLMVVVNGALAQWLAGRQGQALRPAPSMRDIELPNWMLTAFAASAALASLVDGNMRFLAAAAAVVLAMPLIFQGMAVVHALCARLVAPKLALTGFYLAMLIFAWPLVIIVLALGVIESFAKIRQRVATT